MQVNKITIPEWLIEPLETISVLRPFLTQPGYLNEHNIDVLFKQHFGINTAHNWLNITSYTGKLNDFGWHNENGVGGYNKQHPGQNVGVIWFDGDVGVGGDFQYLDDNMLMQQLDFTPGTHITFDVDTMHRVTQYNGDNPRISLNYTW